MLIDLWIQIAMSAGIFGYHDNRLLGAVDIYCNTDTAYCTAAAVIRKTLL